MENFCSLSEIVAITWQSWRGEELRTSFFQLDSKPKTQEKAKCYPVKKGKSLHIAL